MQVLPPLSQSPNLFSFSFIAVALALQGRVVRYRGGPCGRTGALQPRSLLGNLVRCLSSASMGLESRSVGFLSLGLGQFRGSGCEMPFFDLISFIFFFLPLPFA